MYKVINSKNLFIIICLFTSSFFTAMNKSIMLTAFHAKKLSPLLKSKILSYCTNHQFCNISPELSQALTEKAQIINNKINYEKELNSDEKTYSVGVGICLGVGIISGELTIPGIGCLITGGLSLRSTFKAHKVSLERKELIKDFDNFAKKNNIPLYIANSFFARP